MIEVYYSTEFYYEAILYKINNKYRWNDLNSFWTKKEIEQHINKYIKIFEIENDLD